MFYIRHALAFIYLVLLILLICGLSITLFKSPRIYVHNFAASTIVGMRVTGFIGDVSLNNRLPGADIEGDVTIDMWSITIDFIINVSSYDLQNQHVTQRYNVEDIPCKSFANTMRTGQVFGILSVFTTFICLVLIISNFFSRLFLPVLWVMVWVNVVCVSCACSMLLRMLFQPSCKGTPEQLPPFTSLAVPEGGFAMYVICMVSFVLTSIMTVFL